MTPPRSDTSSDTNTRALARPYDVVCLSHLRWNFVFQRPQHLMTACARDRRVLFFEEPVRGAPTPAIALEEHGDVTVATPQLPDGLAAPAECRLLRQLLDQELDRAKLSRFVLWYYTPMAIPFTRHLQPAATVYDCMDELSAFANAPPELRQLEAELLDAADLVFTGGQSLYEAKQHLHRSVHAFPSSVDVPHFRQARQPQDDPRDQASVPRPRLGFFGVIDERMDLALLDGVAAARPEWHLVLVGPTVKIDPAVLPVRDNIHYLGQKSYLQLPSYLAGWEVALLPFALNDSTRYISPTKTPEYLAAGKPVVSTSIRDVVRPYGPLGLVRVADGVADFVAAIEASLTESGAGRIEAADRFLRSMSWEGTWQQMRRLMDAAADDGRWSRLRPGLDRAGPEGLRPAL